jgi:hypothetical protein
MNVALYTCGVLTGPPGSQAVEGFFRNAFGVFGSASEARGCVAHMAQDAPPQWPPSAQDWGRWGEYACPSFYEDVSAEVLAATLSVWQSIRDLQGFAYGGLHKEALKHREEWFVQSGLPQYVLWRIPDGHTPTWGEAARKLECLHERGPTTEAFTFSSEFARGGRSAH